MLLFLLLGILFIAFGGLFLPVKLAEKTATLLTGLVFIISLSSFIKPIPETITLGLQLDGAAFLFAAVISFISLIIQAYSLRHLEGHRFKRRTFRYFLGLTISLLIFAVADHLLLMAAALLVSNLLLSSLMAPQKDWSAARVSSNMIWKQLGGVGVVLFLVAGLAYFTQGSFSLDQITEQWTDTALLPLIGGLLIIAALGQSAIWPLHRWLIASANAPTPVSAFMHAGLVNGGALILYKWAPVLGMLSWSMLTLILLGGLTAIVGTIWMLVQSDVKRTLTCSTMGQMGFMIMQCGLGLFPAAIAHMIWHGFFKASLFLSAGSTVKAAKNKSLRLEGPMALPVFLFGITIGLMGAFIFWRIIAPESSLNSVYLLLILFCGITCAHAVMTILQPRPEVGRALIAGGIGLLGATVYGTSVWLVETQLMEIGVQPLTAIHIIIAAFFLLGWLMMIFRAYLPNSISQGLLTKLYVRALLDSQPASQTMNLQRKAYRL